MPLAGGYEPPLRTQKTLATTIQQAVLLREPRVARLATPTRLKSFWLANQRETTYSPFTLTCYLRPRRWAMSGGLGNQCIGTGSVASLSAAQFSPPLVSSMYQVGRVRALTYSYKLRSGIKKSLADWRDFSVCVGITYLPGKSPCKYCRRR